MTIKVYEVGGCVRDYLLGVPTKDVDFVVIGPSYEAMRAHLLSEGFDIFRETPEYLTIRCGVPEDHPLRKVTKDADFVLARKDGAYSDGRRPDEVEPGTLADDLARRDFTVNALARDPLTGEVIDLHNGIDDLAARLLVFVGDAETRISEDGLRILRGMRFAITKGFTINEPEVYNTPKSADLLREVSTDRVAVELNKMLAYDTLATLQMLEQFPHVRDAVFSRDGLSLLASMKKRRGK
jgi:tRNA nucleotidyltransferase/poly(A) polymerase